MYAEYYCSQIVLCVTISSVPSSICFFFKQNTAYDVRISDWSSDVCSSDLPVRKIQPRTSTGRVQAAGAIAVFKIVDFSRIGKRVKLSPSDKAAVAVQHFGTQFRRA